MGRPQKNKLALGVDLGGSNIKAGIINADGEILRDATLPAEAHKGPLHVIEQIAKGIYQLLNGFSSNKEAFVGIGVGSPGSVDIEGGTVKYPPNFPGC